MLSWLVSIFNCEEPGLKEVGLCKPLPQTHGCSNPYVIV